MSRRLKGIIQAVTPGREIPESDVSHFDVGIPETVGENWRLQTPSGLAGGREQ